MNNIAQRFAAVLDAAAIRGDDAAISQYAGDRSFAKAIAPRLVLRPDNADQVEEIVRLANEMKTPLIPVSSPPPHYKGDTVPSVPGCVVVDLSGMNKIISINRTYRMAVVEPGVTYAQLQQALKAERMTLSAPLAPRANKSVLTSALETEPRLNSLHQWCALDPLRCAEVIWGDGNRMYTGEAANGPRNLEKQWEKDMWQWEAVGPMMFDFFRMLTGAQGTMGIVTWASLRCELLPQAERLLFIPAARLEDLIDFSCQVLRLRFSDGFFILNHVQLAQVLGQTPEQIRQLRQELPAWTAIAIVCGRDILPEERAAAQQADVSDIAAGHGLACLEELAGVSGEAALAAISQPCEGTYWKERCGSFQDIFFETTLQRTPEFCQEMACLAARAGHAPEQTGVYLQPQNMGVSWHCAFSLYYDANQDFAKRRCQALFTAASERVAALGGYYLRPYGIWSRLQLNKDAQSYKVLQQLKGIFDPNGILNPGKLCNY